MADDHPAADVNQTKYDDLLHILQQTRHFISKYELEVSSLKKWCRHFWRKAFLLWSAPE